MLRAVILPVALYKVNTRDRLYNAVSTRALIGDAATEPLQCWARIERSVHGVYTGSVTELTCSYQIPNQAFRNRMNRTIGSERLPSRNFPAFSVKQRTESANSMQAFGSFQKPSEAFRWTR